MKSIFSLNTETMMIAAVPWFPDNSQYRKSSICGPVLRKHTYMGTVFFPPKKMDQAEEEVWEELI